MACEKSQGRLDSYGRQRGERRKRQRESEYYGFCSASLPHCKNMHKESFTGAPSYMHILKYWGDGESPAMGDHCDWYFLECAPSILL